MAAEPAPPVDARRSLVNFTSFFMSGEILFVFILITVAAVLMASNRVLFDIVALLVVLALMLSGILTAAG